MSINGNLAVTSRVRLASSAHVNTKQYLNVPYSTVSSLNVLNAYVPNRPAVDGQGVWIIYIHGGAWRDCMIDSSSFEAALDVLLEEGDNQSYQHMAGFVSLDYRLSHYPSHPLYPSSPNDPSRNARHPDHLHDVLAAIRFLANITHDGEKVGFPDTELIRKGRYILCGHSCGATLAIQAVNHMTRSDLDLPKPLAVMGIEGIYDIPGVIRRNTHPAYREFITSAFGSDESQWLDASPVHQKLHGWEGSVVLIHSDKDELVEQRQTDDMAEAMIKQGWTTLANYSDDTEDGATNKHREATLQGKKRLLQATIHCLHDEVWQRGTELAKAIRLTVAIST